MHTFDRESEHLIRSSNLSTKHGFDEIMRATDKRLLTAYRRGGGKFGYGPMIIHGSYKQLYSNPGIEKHKKNEPGVGQDVFITNLGAYSVLRPNDMG